VAAETYFVVDVELAGSEGACIDFMPPGHDQVLFSYSRGGPWFWNGLYGEDSGGGAEGAGAERRVGSGDRAARRESGGAAKRRDLRNVALGAAARQSSVSDSSACAVQEGSEGVGGQERGYQGGRCVAANAVDGIRNVFHSVPFERSHTVLGGQEGEEEWWEVDLAGSWHVRAVDVWGPLRARGLLQYPQTLRAVTLAPFTVELRSKNGDVLASYAHAHASDFYSSVGLLAEAEVVRVVRQRPAGGAALALLEVEVWAEDAWVCEEQCQHGSCEPRRAHSMADRAVDGAGEEEGRECVCAADWIGRSCDTHAFMAWKFLPFSANLPSSRPEAAGAGAGPTSSSASPPSPPSPARQLAEVEGAVSVYLMVGALIH